ncbi:MAG: UvrD-helicase domain-containing protein [Gammaproteobacteria bacterium]|nr:UvrD-helicase domain-containing protein [Gammaproteobacteria bacterium]
MPGLNNKPNSLDACNPALNATVSASAGSGKTWLLITRIVRLLIDGAEPGNIIALTFTRKAAGEMQIRLNQRLFEMAIASDSELEQQLGYIGCDPNEDIRMVARDLYEKLMSSLYPIRIQTFHAFCQDILSRFPLEADIPPGFDLLEDSSLLERQAWQTLFDKAGSHSTSDTDNTRLNNALDAIMQFCNGPDNTQTALRSFLSHRSDWWAYTAHSQDPVEFASQKLAQSLQLVQQNDKDSNGPVEQFLNEASRKKLTLFAGLLRNIKNNTREEHASSIEDALNNKADSNTVFTLIQSAFIKKDGDILVKGRQYNPTLEKKLGAENANRFVELHLEMAERIQGINEQLKRIQALEINQAWYYAGNQYVEIFQRLKKEMRLLDFTDLEWKCYRLLQHADNAHWVQYKIDQRIDHLLIDEFQDTNPTQWSLLSPILEEIAANPEQRCRSIFLVGDEKQSIYSFRRANPALQAQASEWLAENLGAQATPLDFSRRSSPAIIHCVNRIFEQDDVKTIMTGYSHHDTWLQELPGKVLLCDLFRQDENEESPETEDIETASGQTSYFRNPLQQPRVVDDKTLRHKEADYIARQILQLTGKPELITDNGTVRAIEYGDIMILMRNRTHIDIYEDTLKHYAIPFIGSKKGGLLDNLEIQDLNCLLNTLITPYNNLALAQVLKSPIFNVSDEDLIVLARHGKSSHWYQRLLQLPADPGIELSKALRRAATLLPRWQKLAEQLPVHDCLDKIFSEGNIIKRYIAANRTENQQKVATNCQRFLELSLETDSGRYPGISRFLQRLAHLESFSDNPPEEPLSRCTESRVRVMTIHGSKGLEAPVVLLADCNSTNSSNNAYASLVRWPASQPRPVNFQLQLNKDNTDQITRKLQQEKLNEQAREELNLLYVALTRAREQLYISGIASGRKQTGSWYQIISSGLAELSQSDTGIDGINGKIHQYLSYDSSVIRSAASNAEKPAETRLEVDTRLLKPLSGLPSPGFMIAPSMSVAEPDLYGITENITVAADSACADKNNANSASAFDETANQAKLRGSIIHRLLELLCNAMVYPAGNGLIYDIKQQLKSEISLQNPVISEHLDSCIQEAVSVFNYPDFESIFNPAAECKTYNEMPIMYGQETRVVYGIADRVIKSADTVFIIDYKSHQLDQAETLQQAALKFSDQLSYYRNGIKKIWPQHAVKTAILFTFYKEIVWLE